MISERLQDAINKHVAYEVYSGYLYLAMSAWFERNDLPGFAHWTRLQAQEELVNAYKFFGYINDRQGTVVLHAIDAPPGNWDSPLALFQDIYSHECKVTKRINVLVDLAMEERDHAAIAFLQWFVSEQVEEEATASTMVGKLKIVEGDGRGLLMLDSESAQRVMTLPPGMDFMGPMA